MMINLSSDFRPCEC